MTAEKPGTLDTEKALDRVMARHQYSGDALIEVLHAAQELYGFLRPSLLEKIAHKLRLPPSRVAGVVTFYHLFHVTPPKEHTAVVCMGTACYAANAPALVSIVEEYRRTHPDTFTAGTGRCLGSCGQAPIVISDGEPLVRVDARQFAARLNGTGVDN
jgi:bidirectional [NiFe] hydrogenase diaphorase subunit